MKRTGPTNEYTKALITALKKKSIEEKALLWKRIATELEMPTRKKRIINLSRINRNTKENETILVPGKILAAGSISHKITLIAHTFSSQAKQKVESAGGKAITLEQFIKEKPTTNNIRIIG